MDDPMTMERCALYHVLGSTVYGGMDVCDHSLRDSDGTSTVGVCKLVLYSDNKNHNDFATNNFISPMILCPISLQKKATRRKPFCFYVTIEKNGRGREDQRTLFSSA